MTMVTTVASVLRVLKKTSSTSPAAMTAMKASPMPGSVGMFCAMISSIQISSSAAKVIMAATS